MPPQAARLLDVWVAQVQTRHNHAGSSVGPTGRAWKVTAVREAWLILMDSMYDAGTASSHTVCQIPDDGVYVSPVHTIGDNQNGIKEAFPTLA